MRIYKRMSEWICIGKGHSVFLCGYLIMWKNQIYAVMRSI